MAGHGGGHGGGGSERWLLTYADLITLLLAFFVLMYGMSNADLEKFRRLAASMREAFSADVAADQAEPTSPEGPPIDLPGGSLSEDFAFIQAELGAFAQDLGLQDSVDVRLRPEGIAVVLSNSAIFASGQAELGEKAYLLLDKIGEILSAMPNNVRVEGHTDDLPPASAGFATNWDLSAARAVTVVRYLSEGAGLRPERFVAAACSQYRPIAENDTLAGRGKNRRVEILVIYPPAAE